MKDINRDEATVDTSRRNALKVVGLGSAAMVVPGLLRTAPALAIPADLIMKPIPRTGEKVPAIGLGTHMTFDIKPGKPREHLGEVMKIFFDGGGRIIDTSPLYGMAEVSIGDFATALGINKDLFIADKIWVTGEWLGDDSHAQRQLQRSMERLWRDQIDLMQVHSLVNARTVIRAMQDWKQDGKIRYIGASHHQPSYYHLMAPLIEKGTLDFAQVRARLFQIVKGRPLPDFAGEIGCESWGQFFLKWIISHPAVTCAIPATTNPKHQTDNIGALKGLLPDKEMRNRMLAHMQTIPDFDKIANLPAYPGKIFDGVVKRGSRKP